MFICIGSPDDCCDGLKSGIFDLIFFYKIIKCAFVAVMSELHAGDVKRNGIDLPGFFQYQVEACIKKLSLLINKIPDQPRTCNTVNFRSFPCYPFHTIKIKQRVITKFPQCISMVSIETKLYYLGMLISDQKNQL